MADNVEQLRRELAEMRTAMEQQQSRIAQLEADVPEPTDGPLRSRRQLLKLAGATVAGAAAAAAGIATSAVPAMAVTGDPLVVGHSPDTLNGNVADKATELDYTGVPSVGAAFLAQAGTSFKASQATYPTALAGWSELAAMPNGIYGFTNVAGGNAVVAINAAGGSGGPALYAQSSLGYGGVFVIGATGKAHLFIKPSSAAGAPVPAGHVNGELYVDSAGVLYYFSAGAFSPLAGGLGGITTMLSAPIRLLETRVAFENPSAGQTKPHRRLNNGETFDLPITGQVLGGISVPAGAKAVIGNVSVTGPLAPGFLTLFPQGAALPTTSSINYVTGQTLNNACVVGLSAAGHISIYVKGKTHVIFDAAGYVM
jgi:hypothetical protein